MTLGCDDGREQAAALLDAPLSAPPLLDSAGTAVYAATRDGRLQTLAWPTLTPRAATQPGVVATVLAVSPGQDGLLLAAGDAAGTLSARDPLTLAEIRRYPESGKVAAMLANAPRQRFAVVFRDRPMAWEIAWNRDAPPVLSGYVHDYRSNEAVPLPGRLTPRAFRLPSPTVAVAAGPAPFELGRIDSEGGFGVVNLDVRREIARPWRSAAALTPMAAAWRTPSARGWVLAVPGSREVSIVEVTGRERLVAAQLGGTVLAVVATHPPGPTVLVAHRSPTGIAVSRVDLRGHAETVWGGATPPPNSARFVAGTNGCVALLDGENRWLAGFDGASGASLHAETDAGGSTSAR